MGEAINSIFSGFDTERDVSQSSSIDPAQRQKQEFLWGQVKDYMSQGYKPYSGTRFEGFNQDQLDQFKGVRDAQGMGQGQYGDVYSGYKGVSGYTPEQLEQRSILEGRNVRDYMNPYVSQVADPAMQQMQDQLTKQMQGIDAGTSDSFNERTGIQKAILQSQGVKDMASTRAGLMKNAYDEAMRLKTGDISRAEGVDRFNISTDMGAQGVNLQGLSGMSGTTGLQRGAKYQDLGALGNIGGMQQQYGQTGRDFDYLQDREQFYYPERKLNMAHNFLSGYGYGNTTSGKQYGNTLKDLAGPAMMAMAVSDRDAKKNIKYSPGEIDSFLGNIRPYSYEYKNPQHGQGPQIGVMAQDLEKSIAGNDIVEQSPDGMKMINIPKAVGLLMAGQARLNQKIEQSQ